VVSVRVVAAVVLAALCATAGGWAMLRPERRAMLPERRDQPIIYAALGDSTVEGEGASRREANYVNRLHERLRAVYPAARVVNLGIGGATSADDAADQVRRAIAAVPHLVTISVGPNDITKRVPVAQFEQRIDEILTLLGRETNAVVVVNLLPDLAVTPRFRSSDVREAVSRQTVLFNEALRRQARGHGAELVDLYLPSRKEVPARPELLSGDGYHPSDAGYLRWAELMWEGVRARIPRAILGFRPPDASCMLASR
jgi:acyl-CoA thioesterase-1